MNPVPSRSTPAGGERRFTEDALIVTNQATGVYSATTAEVRMDNPSTRLDAILAIGFQPSNGTEGAPTGLAAWTVAVTGWKRLKSGLLIQVNALAAATPLPTSVEFTTGVDQMRALITVPNAPGSGTPAGFLWASATWEPAPGAEMPDDELAKLFQSCHCTARGITTSNTGA